MIVFRVNSQRFKVPQYWAEITLGDYIAYLESVEASRPELLKELLTAEDERRKEILEKMTTRAVKAKLFPFYVKSVAFWSGLDERFISGADGGRGIRPDEVEKLFFYIEKLLNNVQAEPVPFFDFKGERYYLPEAEMRDATVIEFMESAELQRAASDAAGGQWRAMSEVIAVLAKKEGETYDERFVKLRAPRFMALDMQTVINIAFFLMRQSERLQRRFLAFQGVLKLGQLKRELTNFPTATAGISH